MDGQESEKSWRQIQKPAYFPVLGFMTGPPGFYRNGGLFRWLKIFMLRAEKDPLFLSQVLHFLDFGVKRRVLDRWLEKPLLEWIREADPGLKPAVFLDSGGFQFLHDANDCLKDYLRVDMGIDVDAGGSYMLQRRLGADYVVSFDYPLDPRLAVTEAWERCERSIANATDLLNRVSQEPEAGRPLPMLAVHGLDAAMAASYVKELFRHIGGMGKPLPAFGLAVGSLVPLALPSSKNSVKILEIVSAVMDSIPEEHRGLPVHALGMSGPIVPFLAYMGVGSFDGSSFIVGAKTLSYSAGRKKAMYDVTDGDLEDCGCDYCRLMGEIGIGRVHAALKGRERGSLEELARFDPAEAANRMDGKSSVYALLAMHNFYAVKRTFAEYGKSGLLDGDPSYLFMHCEKQGSDLGDALAWLALNDEATGAEARRTLLVPPSPPPEARPAGEKQVISLSLTSDSFNILEKKYRPEGRIALILPCTPQKPYASSKTHTRIMDAVRGRFGERRNLIEKITLSGLYGPVPETHELDKPVMRYDYRLRTYDIFNPQKQLVKDRLADFLDKYSADFKSILFLVSKSPYREIAESVSSRFPESVVIPEKGGKADIASEKCVAMLLEELCRRLL